MNRSRAKRQLVFVAAAVIVLAGGAFSANTAFARGGGGGHKGGGTTGGSTATCSVAPNPVASGAESTIKGSGFTPYSSVGYLVSGAGGTQMGFAVADSSGTFSSTATFGWPGTNTVSAGSAICTFQVI